MATQIDEDELKLLLMGDCNEQHRAIGQIYDIYSEKVVNFVKFHYPSFSPEQLADVMQETFIDFYNASVKTSFDFEKPLLPFLKTIGYRRAADELRKISKLKPLESLDDAIIAAIPGTAIGDDWQAIVDRAEVNEVKRELKVAVLKMPNRQRQVAQVYVDYLPEEITREDIRDEIFRRSGEKLTVVQIKGALAAIKVKFRALIPEKGARHG